MIDNVLSNQSWSYVSQEFSRNARDPTAPTTHQGKAGKVHAQYMYLSLVGKYSRFAIFLLWPDLSLVSVQ